MSKIYEALQNVQQVGKEVDIKKSEVDVKKKELTRTSDAKLLPSLVDADFDSEMVTLYQNIEARLPDLSKKVIQFIGSREGEGTSTIVKEFAKVVAKRLGKSLFLLNADQYNTRQQIFLHVLPNCGLEELPKDEMFNERTGDGQITDLDERIVSLNKMSTPLDFYSPQMSGFWECLKQKYDLILVDSAPLSVSPEGIEIARRVDGVVMVVEAEETRWQVVKKLKDKLENVGANIIGVVFNKRRFYIPEAIYKKL
jgi:protein-tyrosine kinase